MDHYAALITAPLVLDCTLIYTVYFIVRGENHLDWLGKDPEEMIFD